MTEPLTAEAALARAAEAGIHLLRIPTPFAVGRVNTYLIEDDPLTLVDSGPNSGRALDELQHQLAEHGRSIDDIELVVLTHQHIDHLGLVDIIVGHSGAEVAAIDKLAGFAERFREDSARDDEFASGVMIRNGIPEDIVAALRTVSSAFRAWGAKAKVTRPLRDGETLELRDRRLEVLHRPGHSPVGHDLLGRGAQDPDRRRPPDQAHLLEPADRPAARRGGRRRPGAAPAGARHLHGVAAQDARAAGRDRALRATESRSPTTSR